MEKDLTLPPPGLFLTDEQTAAIKAEDDARRLVEIEEGMAQIEEQWPKALKHAEDAPKDAPHSVRLGAVEHLVHAREHLMRELGGDPDGEEAPPLAKGKRRLKDDTGDKLHHRGDYLHERVKTMLEERKQAHRKPKGS